MPDTMRKLEKNYSKKAAGDLTQVMRRARSKMAPSLRVQIPLAYQYFSLINISGIAASNGKTSDSKFVCANLLARIARDVLAIISLASDGLADQTSVIAASTYECAVTIGAIAGNNSEARKWLDHADMTKSIESVKKRSAATEKALKLEYELYDFYSTLCAPKHGNPATQRHAGRDVCKDHAHCSAQYFFPTGSERDQFEAATAIEIALMMASIAIYSFITNHVDSPEKAELMQHHNLLELELDRLLERRANTSS